MGTCDTREGVKGAYVFEANNVEKEILGEEYGSSSSRFGTKTTHRGIQKA